MALQFNKIQPVQFGDIEVMPQLDEELKLRVRTLAFSTPDEIQSGAEVLAKCFPSREEEVKKFITENLGATDLVMLKTYLVDGESGLAMLKEAVSDELQRTLRQGIEEAKNV